ncbi:M1 family metallopeptidase [Nocardioides panacisoli]|uniref:Aminopeptidase N n=1 Tax=Nocardioides panacisoli TaxID=627624 RepID=A0ABP7HWB5_9ACTN
MPVSRPLASIALVTAVALTGTLPGAPAEAGAAQPGAPGIGDPYYPEDGNGGIDVRHYAIDLTYAFDPAELSGSTTLEIEATSDLSSFDLDFLLPVDAVTVDGVDAAFSKPSEHELQITPATALAKGDVASVRVEYDADPSAVSWENPGDPGGERSWMADEQEVVTANEPHMAPWWFPSNDHPRDKATFDISITTDAGKNVIANGEQVGDPVVVGDQATTHWRMKEPMATYLAFFAAGHFAVRQGTTDGIPWVAAVSKQFGTATRRGYLRLVRRSGPITAWLRSELGPYPFDSTGGLVTPLNAIPYAFALENQSRPTYQGGIDEITEVHELAHQWFGDAVSVRRWKDIWLNEGFASYMEHRWTEDHGGETTRQWLDHDFRDLAGSAGFWRVNVTDPGANVNTELFDTPVYERGALALAALRNRIGKHAFDGLLRDWAAQHRDGSATVGMFEHAAAQAAGHPMDRFFHAWLVADRPPRRTAANGF